MKPTTFLLIIISFMHFVTLINVILFNGNWNGFVIAINTFLFILAFALVLLLIKQEENE